MDSARKRLITVVIFVTTLFSVNSSLAYDDKTTHPALTDEIVDFYNLSGGTLSPEEKEWIVTGSTLEDTPPRWINHFYDPVHKHGWSGDKAGSVPQSVIQLLSRIGISTAPPLSAVDWAENYAAQEEYESYGGNRTWRRGIEYFADGNKEEAYRTLGHVMHLLEDMSVPDHTRDDTHVHPLEGVTGDPGSPYELWAEKWTRESIKSEKIAKSLTASEASPPNRSSIADYLTAMAEYSNKYFFSKDTINDPKYEFPKIVREDGNFGYGLDDEGKEFPLVGVDTQTDSNRNITKTYFILNREDYYPILKSYFSRLSRRVVLEGAGVIRLFKKQTDEAIVNKEFPQHLVAIDPSVRRAFAFPNLSLFGLIGKLIGNADRLINTFTRSIGNLVVPSSLREGGALALAPYREFAGQATIPGAGQEPIPSDVRETQLREEQQRADSNSLADSQPSQSSGGQAPQTVRRGSPQAETSVSPSIVESPLPSQEIVVVRHDSPQVKNTTNPDSSLSLAPNTSDSTRLAPSGGGVSETPAPQPVAQTAAGSSAGSATSTATSTSSVSATTGSTQLTTSTAEVALPTIQNFQAKFSTSTLDVSLSWSALGSQNASTTFVVKNTTNSPSTSSGQATSTIAQTSSTVASFSPSDFSHDYNFSVQAFSSSTATSSVATTTAVVSDYFLNVQSVDADESHGSWYSDNWYRLGTGFYGTIYAVTLEGYVDGSDFSTSHVTLKEFTDVNYSHLNQSFTISDNAPFTATTTKVTIKNLNIPLQSNKFYRLDTKQDHQNLSVILRGTNATGTAMWNEFVSGTGGVTRTHSFYPYIQMVMAKNYPPLAPPTAPANPSSTFNAFDLVLNVSWASSTDPDTNDSLLSYQLNYSTSSELLSSSWVTKTSPASVNVMYPNSYTIGIRALDDFNNTSTVATLNWSFPANFVLLPSQRDHSYQLPRGKQKVLISATSTIDAVAMWLGGSTGDYCCSQSYMRIFTDAGVLVATTIDHEITLDQHAVDQQILYVLDSPVTLGPGSYWFVPTKGPANTTNGTRIFGSSGDTYSEGLWLDVNGSDEGRDAYFRLRQVL